MGVRLHFAKIYDVEYSSQARFNYETYRINKALWELFDGFDSYEGDDPYTATQFEISRWQIECALQNNEVKDAELAQFLREALDSAYSCRDTIVFAWF